MLVILRKFYKGLFIFVMLQSSAQSADWQEQLSATGHLTQSNVSGKDTRTLSRLLADGRNSLASGSMPNVAGLFEYCARQKLLIATDPQHVKNQLLDRIGLVTPQQQNENPVYLDGLSGILHTRNGLQIDLNTLKNAGLGKKLKLKACDVILDQSLSFIS